MASTVPNATRAAHDGKVETHLVYCDWLYFLRCIINFARSAMSKASGLEKNDQRSNPYILHVDPSCI